jgi:subtilase family serine protease
VHINGGGGLYGGAAIESALDVQQELTGAPGAHVILYDIPDLSDTNIFGGYVQAIEENRVDLLSSSFGGCELSYFPKYNGGQDYRGVLKAYHELFQQGNAQGISFLASSGDEAGRQCPNLAYMEGQPGKFIPSVGFPANDPNVTAVGGGNLVTTYLPGSLDSAYAGENAWSDPEIPYDPYGFGVDAKGGAWGAGSGYSKMWPAPAYQSLVDTGNTAQRAVPDVGMMVGGCPGGIAKTDPKTGQCNGGNKAYNGNGNTDRSAVVVAYGVGIGGGYYGVIGTSVSSPEFAGAMALLIEQQGRMGNLNEYLYRVAAKQARQGAVAKFLHTNIPGYNGVVSSNVSATYNLSTGVGTPVVSALVGAKNVKEAGTPRTPSNP